MRLCFPPRGGLLTYIIWCGAVASAQPAPPALPQVYLNTTYVRPTGRSIAAATANDLKNALAQANPGDEIVLHSGSTFVGNFVLPNKPGSGWITIRSSKMSALPKPGNRVRPSDAANMGAIVTNNSMPALATQPGAHQYRLMGIEIAVAPKVPINYQTVYLGDGKTPDQLPTDIILDRVYVHGSVLCHCKRGVTLNSRRTAIIDSYISEFHTVDQDAQAISGYNGTGPFKIVNNYLEGSTECVLFGGAPGSIPNVIASDIEFRRNHLARPVRWRSSVIPAPQPVRAAARGGGGLAASSTYYYTVVASGPADYTNLFSNPSAEVAVPLGGSQRSVALSWPAVTYGDATDSRTATGYQVYRTSDPPTAKPRHWVYFKAPGTSFTDTGDAGTAGNPPGGHAWLVKNLFELKNAQRVLVDSNLMEYCWVHGQTGQAIMITPRIENGSMPWAVTNDLTFTNNLIRHAGTGVNMFGIDNYCTPTTPCVLSARALFRNNVFEDISSAKWGGYGRFFMLGNSKDVTFDHNTSINDSQYGVFLYGNRSPANVNLAITNNIFFGEVIGNATTPGSASIQRFAPGTAFSNNIAAGATARLYDPAGQNLFPHTWTDVGFVDFANGNLRLSTNSTYRSAAGPSPGADLDTVLRQTTGVATGYVPAASDAPVVASVLNGASLLPPVAPGSLVSIYGVNFAYLAAQAVDDPLPRDLADTSVSMNGLPAPLLYADGGRIDAQVPFEIPPGIVLAVVTVAGVDSAPLPFTVAAAAPGLYMADSTRALAFNVDGSLNGSGNPAAAGNVVTVFITGQGQVSPAVPTGFWTADASAQPLLAVSVTVGGQPAQINFTGLAPGTVGILQINFTLPSLPTGDYPVSISVGDGSSNSGLVSIA